MPDSNRVVVEQNTFANCTESAVLVVDTHYEGIDLGHGALGSIGQNTFVNPTAFDVKLSDTDVDIHAAINSWSNPVIETGIWDKTDDPLLGNVTYQSKPPRPNIKAWRRAPIIPELMWHPVGGTPIYKIQVSTRPDFKTMIYQADVMANYIRLKRGLPTGRSYFWRVRSVYPWGTSMPSRVGRFSVERLNRSPGPVLLSPTSGSVSNSVAPILKWEPIRDATAYHIQVSTTPDFGVPVLDNTEIVDPRDVLAPLQPGTTYYWHVRGITNSGLTDWSRTFNFKTRCTGSVTSLDIKHSAWFITAEPQWDPDWGIPANQVMPHQNEH